LHKCDLNGRIGIGTFCLPSFSKLQISGDFRRTSIGRQQGELYKALEFFTEKICKGRWNDVRKPTDSEWKQTMVLSFDLTEASAKVRTGPPKDDEEDYTLDVWAGVVPLKIQNLEPIADPDLKSGVKLPGYLY
jgi:hypothetical protein